MGRPRTKDKHLPPCLHHKHGAYFIVKRGVWGPNVGKTLAEALEEYARQFETNTGSCDALIDEAFSAMKPNLSANTIKSYTSAAKRLKKMLQQFQPHQVKPKHSAAIKKALAKTPNYCNRVLSFARQVWDYGLEQWPAVEWNPFAEIKRHAEKKRTRLISMDEYARIYAQADDRLQIVMDLCIRTAQRITAVLRIRRSDLTDEGIRFGKHKTDGKGVVAWTPELWSIKERALALHGALPRMTLLYNRKGKAPDYRTVRDQWDAACKRAGVEDAHLHDLRAVAGTWAKKQGLNPQALLMHASPQNTERYLRDKEEPLVAGPSFGQSIRPVEKIS